MFWERCWCFGLEYSKFDNWIVLWDSKVWIGSEKKSFSKFRPPTYDQWKAANVTFNACHCVIGEGNRLKTDRKPEDSGQWAVEAGRAVGGWWIAVSRRQTTDGRRQTADDGRRTADGGRQNGGRWTADGERRTADGRRQTADGGRRTVDGRRQTADGRRRTADGGRWVRIGRWALSAAWHPMRCSRLAGDGPAIGRGGLSAWCGPILSPRSPNASSFAGDSRAAAPRRCPLTAAAAPCASPGR